MKRTLGSINLLQELEREPLDSLRCEFTERRFPKNSLVFEPRHPENMIFIVKEGRIRIYLAFEDKEFTLALLEPGDVYSTHTRAFVAALDDATVLTMDTAAFMACMAAMPELSQKVVSVLGDLLKQSFSIIHGLAFHEIGARLSEYLAYEARSNGIHGPNGVLVSLGMTVEELAGMIGSTRQTVSKLINGMIRDGLIIKKARGTYLIPDLALLQVNASLESAI